MGAGLSQFSTTWRGSGLQGLLHLSELRGKDSVDDLHNELDRASAEGFSTGYKDVGSHAQRGVGSAADGQNGHG